MNYKNNTERYGFIEGMRGVAAMMVLMTHYCSAFLPAFARVRNAPAHYPWELWLTDTPAFSLINGTAAVYMFFTISGFVLAGSFLNSNLGAPSKIAKRFIRLYPPVVCSVLFATLLLWAVPSAHIAAAHISMSNWLSGLALAPFTRHSILGEALLSSMLTGYGGVSIFDHAPYLKDALPLTPINIAANIPLWSLHAEFWGSMLLVAVSSLYLRLPKSLFWATFFLFVLCTGTSQYSLFLAGFAAYVAKDRLLSRCGLAWAIVGYALIGLGVILSFTHHYDPFQFALDKSAKITLMASVGGAQLQQSVAAISILLGICLTPASRSTLCNPVSLWLGKISFGLYLTHIPILFTLAAVVLTKTAGHLGYGYSIVLTCCVAWPISLAIASVYERYVDRPAVSLSRRVTKKTPISIQPQVDAVR